MSSTTLAKRSIGPAATTNQRKKFMPRKHHFVGLFFGVIAISPTWLFLLEPNLVASIKDAYGASEAIMILVAVEFIVVLACAVCLNIAMPREEA